MNHCAKLRSALAVMLCLSFALLSGCKEAVLDFRNAEINHGKIYARAANEPFTGDLTNIMRFKPATDLFEQVRVLKSQVFRSDAPEFLALNVLCDAEVKQGILHGNLVCSNSTTGKPYLNANMKDGIPEGSATLYAPDGVGVVVKVSFKDGLYEGTSEVFSQNGKLVLHQEWRAGKLNGKFEQYALSGSPLVRKATMENGTYNGEEEVFDDKTGKRIAFAQWSQGQLHGKAQQWDTSGQLILDEVYERHVLKEDRLAGQKPASAIAAALSTDSCVEQWTAAHRKVIGQDGLITGDQLQEWDEWCKDGKRP